MERAEDGMGVVTALVRASFLVDAVYAASARDHGLTPQQGRLLCVLLGRPYGQTELGAALGLVKSSLTGLVDRTERNGLVAREPDPADSRATRVALTTRGRRLARTFYDDTCARVAHLPDDLSDDERALLAGLLERVVLKNDVPTIFP